MLVKKDVIRKLVDHFYQVANYLIEDQLQAMQLIIDVATGMAQKDEKCLYQIDNEYYEKQFLVKLIALAKRRYEHLKKDSTHKLDQRASVYLYEIKGESISNISLTLNISEQEVMAFLDQQFINQVPSEYSNGTTVN